MNKYTVTTSDYTRKDDVIRIFTIEADYFESTDNGNVLYFYNLSASGENGCIAAFANWDRVVQEGVNMTEPEKIESEETEEATSAETENKGEGDEEAA